MKKCKVEFNGHRTSEHQILWPFWLELVLTAVIPFIIWWSVTPTNVLNSSTLWKALETVGFAGCAVVFFAAIPIGIIGIRATKRMSKLRAAAKVLSIINLCAGIFEVGMLIVVFCAVLCGVTA